METTATLLRRRFRAMGTEIELLVEAEEAERALAAAEAEFHRLEALLSRFRPESELSRLNEAGELDAGPDLRRVVELALAGHARTGGRFDVTVHDALVAAGYDRSFELVPAETDACPGMDKSMDRHGQRSMVIHVQPDRIRLGQGVRIDLGGIG